MVIEGVANYEVGQRERLPESPPWGHRYRQCVLALNKCLRMLLERAALPPGATVIDYGCGLCQYREFLPEGTRYLPADLPGNPQADIEIGLGGRLPIADATADLVLSTQVLEHVESPEAYLAECLRVLKPNGSLLLTTHGVFRYHPGPHDFWRWTHTGLSRLVETSGFDVTSLEGLIAGPAAAIQMFQDLTMHRLPPRLRPIYIGVLQSFMGMLDRRMSDQARLDNAWDYAVLATPHPRGNSG